jgi:hypothetical protein
MDQKKFVFERFTKESIDATQQAWEDQMDAQGGFDLDYSRVLTDARAHMDYAHPADNEVAYGVFAEGMQNAVAIVSVVHTPKPPPVRGWLKMLQVNVGPEYDEVTIASDLEKRREVLNIYAKAIHGTIRLGAEHPSRVVKLYGRNQHLLDLLAALASYVEANPIDGTVVTMEGRWLVLRVQ